MFSQSGENNFIVYNGKAMFRCLKTKLIINYNDMSNENIASVSISYSDGKDYSHLKANTDENPEHDECVYCGSNNQTITPDADICHDCGEVYT